MKFVVVIVVLALVAFLAYRRLRGSGSSLPRTDPERLRDEFRRGSSDRE